MPALETERPQRNDALLRDIADKTRGDYYVGLASRRRDRPRPLARVLQPQDQVSYLPGSRDKKFEQILMTWLMVLICRGPRRWSGWFAVLFDWLRISVRRRHASCVHVVGRFFKQPVAETLSDEARKWVLCGS